MEERGGERELRGARVGETVVGICDMRDESVLNKTKIKTRKPAERIIRSISKGHSSMSLVSVPTSRFLSS